MESVTIAYHNRFQVMSGQVCGPELVSLTWTPIQAPFSTEQATVDGMPSAPLENDFMYGRRQDHRSVRFDHSVFSSLQIRFHGLDVKSDHRYSLAQPIWI
jgi:hypothetical protein